QKTSELVQEISAASGEQNSGADQINKAIMQLDQVIQQNASASEEMASMAEELSGQSEHLHSTVGFFQVNQQTSEQRRLSQSAGKAGQGKEQHAQGGGEETGITLKNRNQQQSRQTGQVGRQQKQQQQQQKQQRTGMQQGNQQGINIDMKTSSGGPDEMDSEFEEF
ncbi:MAG: chemotaxis protein, partial [Spirochaetales bacterium]|nr:chemotaxis protein [Spirochaetales bacterium]MCF7938791.1 chemotaxis protein [Spirochaetales bacterium]